MEQRMLGRSRIKISPLGMGCWAIGGLWSMLDGPEPRPGGWGHVDDAESIRAIQQAVDLGINFFDTAANYGCGHSERILGQAVEDRREQVVIATKFGHVIDEETKIMRPDDSVVLANLRGDCEASLRRLGTDYIDLYQFHEGEFDPVEAIGVRDLLEELVKEGKIRAYGWSTDLVDRAEVFAEGEHCASIQFRLNVIFDAPEMLALCEACDLASINKSPLFMGLLTGKFTPDSTFGTDDVRNAWNFKGEQGQNRLKQVDALREVLTSDGRTPAQGALAWIWARSERTIPLPGFKNQQQVEENAGALHFGPLNSSQMAQIDSILGRA